MARIVVYLGSLNILALLCTLAVGIFSWSQGKDSYEALNTYLIHFCLGMFTVIFNLGLHCLVFIYFLGTGRWVKEVAIAYKLPDEPNPKLTRELKRRTFPVALLAMVIPICTAAAGMHQQMDGRPAESWRIFLHLGLAVVSILVNVWALWVEYRDVSINVEVLDRVMVDAERIRAEQGLPASAEAWNTIE